MKKFLTITLLVFVMLIYTRHQNLGPNPIRATRIETPLTMIHWVVIYTDDTPLRVIILPREEIIRIVADESDWKKIKGEE